MLLCDLRAVTEGLCGDGGWHVQDELAQGAVAGAEQVDADVSDPLAEVAVVQRLVRAVAGEQPGGVGAGRGVGVRPGREVLVEQLADRLGQDDRVLTKTQPPDTAVAAAVGDDVVEAQSADPGQGLGVEQQQYRGEPVGDGLGGAVETVT